MPTKVIYATAHEIASNPDYFDLVFEIGKNCFECLGYSKTGKTVVFGRLKITPDNRVQQINVYISPDQILHTPTKGE